LEAETKKMTQFIPVVTPRLQLQCIERDVGTQGSVFLVWPPWGNFIFVSQSLPALAAWINKQGADLRVASLYKVSRGVQQHHLGWRVEKHARRDLDMINARLARFEDIIFFTREPDNWIIADAEASPRPTTPGAAALSAGSTAE
jgi:hypothetical protein